MRAHRTGGKAMRDFGPAVLACLILLTGCGSTRDLIVAKVGNSKITIKDFEEASAKLPSFKGTKEDLLWTIIDKELLVMEAYSRGLDTASVVINSIQEKRQTWMYRRLKERLARGVRITEAQMRCFYKERGLDRRQEVRASHIVVESRPEAEDIIRALKQGADFAELARERSLDKHSAAKGGDLGWWREGEVIGPLAEKVFSMKEGELSEPFKSRSGNYHIIKVMGRRPIGFERQKPLVANRLRREKEAERYQKYINEIERRIHLQINPRAMRFLLQKGSEVSRGLPELSAEQQAQVILKYRGGGSTVADYIAWLQKRGARHYPDFSDSSKVARSLKRFALSSVVLPEAYRHLRLDRSHQLASYLKKEREEQMVTELVKQEIESKVITPEALRQYWESHRDSLYHVPPKVTIEAMLFETPQEARKAFNLIKAGAPMSQVAEKFPPFAGKWQNYRRFSLFVDKPTKRRLGAVVDAAYEAAIGQLNGPLKTSFLKDRKHYTGYTVFRVLDKQPAHAESLDIPRVKKDVIRRLKREQSERIDELFQKLLVELRVKYSDKIEIYQDGLRFVPDVDLSSTGKKDRLKISVEACLGKNFSGKLSQWSSSVTYISNRASWMRALKFLCQKT